MTGNGARAFDYEMAGDVIGNVSGSYQGDFLNFKYSRVRLAKDNKGKKQFFFEYEETSSGTTHFIEAGYPSVFDFEEDRDDINTEELAQIVFQELAKKTENQNNEYDNSEERPQSEDEEEMPGLTEVFESKDGGSNK